ncbi:hypothetical protein Ddye_020091 [Dipteronia dyeriana]|uniref:Uncharacterized protein n=1 Tax=Dipteronia dyeriana TaxID=168575 RepID=A0AAD9WVP2_9ROSI|nr:hypothetical protein Ddye_020091 [Dipteronia dyeriana]
MATEAGESQHLNFIEPDCNNFIMRKRTEFLKKAVANRREKKRLVETATKQTKRNLFCVWNVEDEASKLFTRKIFHCYQDELKKLVDWRLEFESVDGRRIVKGARNDQSYNFVKLELLKLEEKMESFTNSEQQHARTNDDINSHNHENEDGENMRFCDPKILKSIGRDCEEPTPAVDALEKQSHANELYKKPHGNEGSTGLANQNHVSTHYSNIFQIFPGGQDILYPNQPSTHYGNGFPIVPHGEGNIPQQNHSYTHYPNGFPNVPGGQRIPYQSLGYQVEHPLVYHYSHSQRFGFG